MSNSQDNVIKLELAKIKETIKVRFRNRHIKTRPICIVGHTGIGKSQAVRQCAEELTTELGETVQCLVTNLQFMEPPDFGGLPYIETGSNKISKHARPEILPLEGKGIWFIDEPNRCNREMRQALLTMLEDRAVNGHPIGKDWIFVLAINPPEADGVAYEVQEFDAALENRISKVQFKPNPNELIKYLSDRYGSDNSVVRWIMNQPDAIDYVGKMRTNPRGLEYLIRAIQADGGNVEFDTVAAEIGIDAAMIFKKFLTSPDYIKPEDIINNFNPDLADRLRKLEDAGRTDIISSLINGVCSMLSTVGVDKLSKKQLENIAKWMDASDADSMKSFWLALGEVFPGDEFYTISEVVLELSPRSAEFLNKVVAVKEGKLK